MVTGVLASASFAMTAGSAAPEVTISTDVAEIPMPLSELDLRTLPSAAQTVWHTFNIQLALPAEFKLSGPSGIALVFPDPAPSLKTNPAYILPLNSLFEADSVAVFDPTTGYNVIVTFDAN